MRAKRTSGLLSALTRPGWPVLVAVVVFTLSLATAAHNHGVFGSDVGAEKVSQSNYTCPACVFDGKPVTVMAGTVVASDAGALPVVSPVPVVFEKVVETTFSGRAPPVS